MSTTSLLRRVLRRDITGLDALVISVNEPWTVEVYLRPREGHSYEAVRVEAEKILNRELHSGCMFHVHPLNDDTLSTAPPLPSVKLEIAALANEQMEQSQYLAGLVRAVPRLSRLVASRQKVGGNVLYVADQDNSCPPDFLDEVQRAVKALTFAGSSLRVEPLNPTDIRNDLANAGFLMPRRNRRLVDVTESDDERFVARIRRLVDADTVDPIRNIDDFEGTRLFTTQSYGQPLPLHCLLAYYDRVYINMPYARAAREPVTQDNDYFVSEFGVQRADFVEFCRSGRVVPVFKSNFGHYPAPVADLWLERLDLPFLSPRDLDYLAARFLWQTNPTIRVLRRDRDALRALARIHQTLDNARTGSKATLRQLEWLLHAADSFEGILFHRGTLSLANISTSAPIAFAIDEFSDSLPTRDIAATVALEGFGALHDVLLAQSFGASLNEAMPMNEQVLTLVANLLRDAGASDAPNATTLVRSLDQLIPAMELHFAPDVPAKEYLDLFDQSETKRVRSLVAQFLAPGGGQSSPSEEELRDRVHELNNAVAKIRRRAIEANVVEVIGDLASAGGAAMTDKLLASALGTAKQSWMKAAMNRIGDALFEDTFLGAKLDAIRDGLNRVPAGAIRIYKLRRKLGRA